MGSDVPAGFWRRLAAKCIDGLWFGFLALIVFVILASATNKWVASLVIFLAGGFYYKACLRSKHQATFGKRLAGVYVVDKATHAAISKRQAYIRYVACFLPALGIFSSQAYVLGNAGSIGKRLDTPEAQHEQEVRDSYKAKIAAGQSLTIMEGITAREMYLNDLYHDADLVFWGFTEILGLVYYGFMTCKILSSPDKRGPHDIWAETIVLRGIPTSTISVSP